jgi:pSer/pThr/pTyr-binding forkhead associated (FHA) protein
MADANRTVMTGPPGDPNRTVMGGPMTDRTVTVKPVQCPVCKSMNAPGLWCCHECGLVFEHQLDGDAFGAPAVQLPFLADKSGQTYVLRPGRQTVGRAGDLVVDDARASRLHAALYLDGTRLEVEDLGSTNGTTLDGEPLAKAARREVAPGAVISVGGFELAFHLPEDNAKTAMPLSGRTAALSAPPTESAVAAVLLLGGDRRELRPGRYTLGRRESNDLVVADPYVSGSHGVVEVDETGVYFTDVGSTNGSVVNDARLPADVKTKLEPGDVLRLGSVEARLES